MTISENSGMLLFPSRFCKGSTLLGYSLSLTTRCSLSLELRPPSQIMDCSSLYKGTSTVALSPSDLISVAGTQACLLYWTERSECVRDGCGWVVSIYRDKGGSVRLQRERNLRILDKHERLFGFTHFSRTDSVCGNYRRMNEGEWHRWVTRNSSSEWPRIRREYGQHNSNLDFAEQKANL